MILKKKGNNRGEGFLREALHVIDNELYRLPYSTTKEEVNNLKKLADKALFQCPHCNAKLIVKYGDTKGIYFSHRHSEACEESKKIDQAEKRYIRQIERETKIHHTIQAILHDEISNQAKKNTMIKVEFGYRAKPDLKIFPDIWVKVADREFALSIITNVNSLIDNKLSNTISKRHQYFLEQGMEPIWFIEKKEQAIEKEKNSIILWDAELTIAAKTNKDREWDSLLASLMKDKMFFKYFNYPVSTENITIDVRSMYYIYSNEERIVVKIQRFLKDRLVKPYRAFLLGEGYEIPFADAVLIKNEFLLSNPTLEAHCQDEFVQEFKQLQFEFKERLRIEQERKLQEEEKREILMQQILKQEEIKKQQLIQQRLEQEERHRKILKQVSEQKLNSNPETTRVSSYDSLKSLLKERIGLTQSQQMELWTTFMPVIGYKNSDVVWGLFVKNDCKSFGELKIVLQNFISKQSK
ncbi:competence protein CoiA family protein [Robertmurraya andreesenii]|uniref:Competence CoiA-like predicted nuclease n=1 Tax=Anoxybacillus andreesenii TaxID=1325932 RepID=A0ABT9V904_9BACL|nr:competence protein CoiA family protein [Robertmurraya andreesenii]MDQ0157397.1 competence CoiA-like predicted nuclease [Robertmurraya andreesenii]